MKTTCKYFNSCGDKYNCKRCDGYERRLSFKCKDGIWKVITNAGEHIFELEISRGIVINAPQNFKELAGKKWEILVNSLSNIGCKYSWERKNG